MPSDKDIDWRPCLMGWCEKAYAHEALLHVVGQTDGRWWWEVHVRGGPSAEGMEDDKTTAQRRAVEHAGRPRLVPPGNENGSEEEG